MKTPILKHIIVTGKRTFIALIISTAAFQAGAIPILVGEGNTGNNSPTTTFNFAQGLLTTFNANNNPDLPALPTPSSFDEGSGYSRFDGGDSKAPQITITSSFAYVIFKWGGADKNPHEVQLYYFDTPGTYDFISPTYINEKMNKVKSHGLSHYDVLAG